MFEDIKSKKIETEANEQNKITRTVVQRSK